MRPPPKFALALLGAFGRELLLVSAVTILAFSSPASAQTDDAELALLIAGQAAERFAAQDFEQAAALLQEAIDLQETPALHFNLGRTLQELERWQEARREYTTYLGQEPEASNRADVEARIAEANRHLEAVHIDEQSPLDPNTLPSTVSDNLPGPTPQSRPESVSAAPWIVTGAGALVLAAAVPFAILSRSAIDDVRDATSHQEALDPASDAESFTVAANVLFVAGGAVLLGGLVWGLVDLLASTGPGEPSALRFDGTGIRGSF